MNWWQALAWGIIILVAEGLNQRVDDLLAGLDERVRIAVKHFWSTRERQIAKQAAKGMSDAGLRGSATGGRQMDGFLDIATYLLERIGVPKSSIHVRTKLELPGYFRPTKKWDLLVVNGDRLLLALETKSQPGPSFGNNFNNRIEEAIGSANDLWTAFREGALGDAPQPWLGYLFMLEDCEASQAPVKTNEPHFKVFPEFKDASYVLRYQLCCRKLVRERLYAAAALVVSEKAKWEQGEYQEPTPDLAVETLLRSMLGHLLAAGGF